MADRTSRHGTGTSPALARAQSGVAAETLRFGTGEGVPNNPDLPVVLVRDAIATGDAAAIKALFEANGWWRVWDYTVFDYHHFHPDAHEALCVAAGWADLTLGGAGGTSLRVSYGDLLILPAGTGHCRTAGSSDFTVCGGYPPNQTARTLRAADEPDIERALTEILMLRRPATDPVWGADGPPMHAWADC